MVETRSLMTLKLANLKRVASGYSSDSKYAVVHKKREVAFHLTCALLPSTHRMSKDFITMMRFSSNIILSSMLIIRLEHTMTICL